MNLKLVCNCSVLRSFVRKTLRTKSVQATSPRLDIYENGLFNLDSFEEQNFSPNLIRNDFEDALDVARILTLLFL